ALLQPHKDPLTPLILIGVDPVPDAHGDKMCWDSMMKLKGCEAAARRQGKHKLRVWLNVSSSGTNTSECFPEAIGQ
uniref:Disabled homolog 1-like n=1 Tax=Takifugu rubripes TaxID=31033 RepID=A0A674MDW7_TAKRU